MTRAATVDLTGNPGPRRRCLRLLLGLVLLAGPPRTAAADTEEPALRIPGTRVLLGQIPYGAFCDGGHQVLLPGESHRVGEVTLELVEDRVLVSGPHVLRKAQVDRTVPLEAADVTAGNSHASLTASTVSPALLARGVDIELSSEWGHGLLVLRVESQWQGTVYGVVSGTRYSLEADTLTLVDADLDGQPSLADRIVYGDRHVWMPWHWQTVSGRTEYLDLSIGDAGELVAVVKPMTIPDADGRVLAAWNEARKDHGIPPGLYDADRSTHCLLHAEYLKTNRLRAHDEDPGRPGFSAAGRAAGMACCIAYGGHEQALGQFLRTLYHRPQLIDPRDPALMLGGNDYAFLMGGVKAGPDGTRGPHIACVQLHPAPASRVSSGAYLPEVPDHVASARSPSLGLPVIARLADAEILRRGSTVDCRLFRVSGSLRTGTRGPEIDSLLSYPDHNTPPGFEDHWGMIALTPLEVLADGVYQAEFAYYTERPRKYVWRFSVGKR